MSVNKERVRLWVDALRSGNYRQGKMQLTFREEDGTEYDCCLGVACKVAIANGLKLPVEVIGENVWYGEKNYTVLPDEVMDWYDFEDQSPTIAEDPAAEFEVDRDIVATHANDTLDWSFEHIADAVEAYYLTPTLFDA